MSSAFTVRGGDFALMLVVALAVVGVMAVRTMRRAERQRARAIERNRLQGVWEAHLDRRSRTR